MAFNLKKVLKALLFSSNQPLPVKEIQAAFSRFHEQAVPMAAAGDLSAVIQGSAAAMPPPPADGAEPAPEGFGTVGSAPTGLAESTDSVESEADAVEDAELYQEVPSLVTATQIREAMDQIAAELKAEEGGLALVEGPNGYRLATHPRFARWVRILRQEPAPMKLSPSAVETLAVVAYRQPVTRSEIESIRGVAAEAGIHKLLERELICITGRADLPGRPLQYGTSDSFLDFVGIRSLDELPASDVLTSRQISDWLQSASSGHKPDDADMGLSNEELPLAGAANEPAQGEPATHAP